MSFQIISSVDTTRGKVFEVKVNERLIKIIFTWHALDAMDDYHISVNNALNLALYPEEVIKGHRNRFIAHQKLGNRLARLVYEYENKTVIVVTFYISYVERYFRGGREFADKILP